VFNSLMQTLNFNIVLAFHLIVNTLKVIKGKDAYKPIKSNTLFKLFNKNLRSINRHISTSSKL